MPNDSQMQMVLLMMKQRRGLSASDRGAATATTTQPVNADSSSGTRR